MPLNTQAEGGVPSPDRKPLRASAPIPSQKPDTALDAVASENVAPSKAAAPKNAVSASISSDPLSRGQAEIYRTIFAHQAQGQIAKADEELKNLRDERLLGHILYQRYMHPSAYKSSFEELKYWLDIYADHPGADNIYKMAMARKPSGFKGSVRQPEKFSGIGIVREPTVDRAKRYRTTIKRTNEQNTLVSQLQREVEANVRKGSPSHALNLLKSHKASIYMDSVEKDVLKARVAAGYFFAGKEADALSLTRQVIERSGEKAPMASWIAGLVSWRKERYGEAARYFAITAQSEYSSGWNVAAAAFWAARSHMRAGNVKEVSEWLHTAYAHPRTFYGLLAARALGRDYDFNWQMPAFTRDYYNLLNADPRGQRALALVAAGQNHLAEIELTRMSPDADGKLYTALMAYADFANLPALAHRVGSIVSDAEQKDFYDMALYPTGPWEPTKGYEIDPSLIHAIMRQESHFNPYASSGSGAVGLMQLMPSTASYITGKDFKDKKRYKLMNPQVNLDIGQYYLKRLLKNPLVGGDIIKLLVAYNAGPGNLQKWDDQIDDDVDPLLFIEMIPAYETRAYVEHVMSNYWIYRLRDKKETPSLDVLAQGHWPSYEELRNAEEFTIAMEP